MKISKLEITGFKSFPEKAAIVFPPGISAIVGPNGCGKSNVIDALRWVMGEQSVKTLRGKNMEDIIFAGAHGKPPLNMAEVTLTIANDNGHTPEEFRDYAEISVTRRLFRSGESAYLINKQPCRLKDIYNLFMGSGVGARTFAIIQQGNIGAIIDAGPDERRLFLEEAAGVTRYKFRKNEALRKVRATQQNLLRLNDIIAEVNRQMAGLHRQAKKAERYKQYQQRAKDLDIRLLLHYFDTYTAGIRRNEQLLADHKAQESAHITEMRTIDAAAEEIKLKRWQKNQQIAAQKNDQHATQRAIDRAETERKHAKSDSERLTTEIDGLEQARDTLHTKTAGITSEIEQIGAFQSVLAGEADQLKNALAGRSGRSTALQQSISRLNQQIDARKKQLIRLVAEEARLKNVYQNAATNRDNLQRRLKRIDEEVALAVKKATAAAQARDQAHNALERLRVELEHLESRIETLQSELNVRAAELGTQVKKTQALELEITKTRSHLATLQKMAADFEWYREGVKAVMRARPGANSPGTNSDAARMKSDTNPAALDGIVGLLADIIDPVQGSEIAVEAALGEALQFILVENQAAALAAVDYLHTNGAGRCGFLPLDSLKPLCHAFSADAVAHGRQLLDQVNIEPGYENVGTALLGHVVLSDTLDEALALFNRNGSVQTVVSNTGDLVSHQGVVTGGRAEQSSGILAKKQELKTLTEQVERLESELAAARRRREVLEKAVQDLENGLHQARSQKNNTAAEALELEKELYRCSEDLKNADRRRQIVELEQEQLFGEESDIDAELNQHNQSLSQISAEVTLAENQSGSDAQALEQLSEELAAHNQTVVDLKLQLAAVDAKLENGRQTMQRLQEFERDSRQRLEQLNLDIAAKNEKLALNRTKLAGAEANLQQLYKNLENLAATLSANESDYSAIDSVLNQHDRRLAAIKAGHEEILEKIRSVELELSEKRLLRDNITARAVERYHCPLVELRQHSTKTETPPEMNVAEMEKELELFRRKMAEIGDVNLSAITEYATLKQRFDFLTTQRDDLVGAIEDLHKVIRKINRITQQRLLETLQAVNIKLNEVFPKLFEGGSARLEFTDPDKPLESGVEFMVHPPGKKLTRMSLLSGGEKALSAIAFIFAVFLIRPASFCLLDEIDAPLDEANVVRFNNLMQVIGQQSQIVMITHNKKSMEFADTLFGVTMELKGVSKVVSVNLMGHRN